MKSSYIALYRIIFSYKCVIQGTIYLNKVSGRRMRAGPLWSCCRILPTAVFCHVVCVSREGGCLLLHAAEPNLHIERNGDGGGIFVSGDNDTDLFFIGVKAVA